MKDIMLNYFELYPFLNWYTIISVTHDEKEENLIGGKIKVWNLIVFTINPFCFRLVNCWKGKNSFTARAA